MHNLGKYKDYVFHFLITSELIGLIVGIITCKRIGNVYMHFPMCTQFCGGLIRRQLLPLEEFCTFVCTTGSCTGKLLLI